MKPSTEEQNKCPYKKPCGLVPCATEGACPKDKKEEYCGITIPWNPYDSSTADPYKGYEYTISCDNVTPRD
jgi:hypothetical protein